MISIFFDEDFHGHSIELFRRLHSSAVKTRTAFEVGLRSHSDPELLDYAAEQGLVMATRDVTSMLGFAKSRVVDGLSMPGIRACTGGRPLLACRVRNSGEHGQRISLYSTLILPNLSHR